MRRTLIDALRGWPFYLLGLLGVALVMFALYNLWPTIFGGMK